MNPIFDEYIKFLQDTSKQPLSEKLRGGYYWLDNQIIKAFDKQGNIHKLYKVITDGKLDVTVEVKKGYTKVEDIDIESWSETVERNKARLEELEKDSLDRIKQFIDSHTEHEPNVLISGGKDSSVTMYLCRQVMPSMRAIFNNTTLDCIDTYSFVRNIDNCLTITPDEGFYQWRARYNYMPTRFSRACCDIFKEGAMVDYLPKEEKHLLFMGMRNEESARRSSYDYEWNNEKWSKNWKGFLPIIKWTEIDIWLYMLLRDIPFNDKYKKGYARVGCAIACPYATKSTWILDKYWYKFMRDRWEKILREDFVSNKKWLVMNCTLDEYITQAWNGGVFRDEPNEEVINEFATYEGIDIEVAPKYFNKYCTNGCKARYDKPRRVKDKQVLSMNMKLFGRNSEKCLCKKCLMKQFEWEEEDWNSQIEIFKEQGCKLF